MFTVSIKSTKPQMTFVMPNGLKNALIKASKRLGCSQAEVVKTALSIYLKDLSLLIEEVKRDSK